jgi:hypothetical protein
MSCRSRSVVVALVVVALSGSVAAQQAPVLSATVAGSNITFSWTPTAGATSYRLEAGTVPGVYLGGVDVGNVNAYSGVAPITGTFYARVVAVGPGGQLPSAEIVVAVGSLVAPPPVPVNLSVARNGTGVLVTWSPGAGPAPLGYRLTASLAPGGAGMAVPLGTNSFAFGPVPPGRYYFRVAAFHAAGASADSADVPMDMPAGGACDAPPAPTVSQSVFGGFVNVSWTPVPGAAGYVIAGYQGGGHLGSTPVGANVTRFSQVLPAGAWRVDVAAVFSCGSVGAPASANLIIDQSTLKMQPREPDPAPGTALGEPGYARGVVEAMAARYRGDLQRSCGSSTWLFRVVEELRKRDKRWGLNWKRANVGDMSHDVITYNWGDEPDEGTSRLRAWDVISGHCGPNPGPAWQDITSPRPPGLSSGAKWTLVPYIQAGFIP